MDSKEELVMSMALDRVNTKGGNGTFNIKEIERYIKDRLSTKAAIEDLRAHATESRKAFKDRGVPVREVDQVIRVVDLIHEVALDGASMNALMDLSAKLLGYRTTGDELVEQMVSGTDEDDSMGEVH